MKRFQNIYDSISENDDTNEEFIKKFGDPTLINNQEFENRKFKEYIFNIFVTHRAIIDIC